MRELQTAYPLTPEPQPLRSMLMLFGFIMLGMTLGAAAAALVVWAGATVKNVTELLEHPSAVSGGWWWLMIVQSLSHVGTFLLPSLLYWFIVDKRRLSDINGQRYPVLWVGGW